MRIKMWWRRLCANLVPRRKIYFVSGDTPPETLTSRHLYVAQELDEDWAAALLCPCGCRAKLELLLLQEADPHWSLSTDKKGYPSLSPSIWRTIGCKSHFFIHRGRIKWC